MKLIVLTRVSDINNPRLALLVNSLQKHKFDFRVIGDSTVHWGVDGMRLHADWLRVNRGYYTHVLHTDGFDTIALGDETEFIEKYISAFGEDCFVWGAEKKLNYEEGFKVYGMSRWQDVYLSPADDEGKERYRKLYEPYGDWRYPNGGQYICPIDLFLEIDSTYDRKDGCNGNQIGSELVLFYKDKWNIKMDSGCVIFQCLNREEGYEFAWTRDGRLYNRVTNTYPIFAHGVGGSDMSYIYNRILSPFYK